MINHLENLMHLPCQITPPFFEVGPKAYLFGDKAFHLAEVAEKSGKKYGVSVIFTPQYTDIYPIANHNKEGLFIFAQHMDALRIGRGIGAVLPEAVKAAGASGVLLNHSEKRLSKEVLADTISRADEIGLISMVCADDEKDSIEIAHFAPNIIVVESPDLIGTGKRLENDGDLIRKINESIWSVNPSILVLHGAGVNSGQDVFNIIYAGSQGSGSTSGIMLASDPEKMLEEMVRSVREAWNKREKEEK